jgi:hypothetical protein
MDWLLPLTQAAPIVLLIASLALGFVYAAKP